MPYLTPREHDTITAALRCFQTVLENKIPSSKSPYDQTYRTGEWIESLQDIAKNEDASDGNHEDVTSDYIDDLITLIDSRNAPYRKGDDSDLRAEPDHVRLKREHGNRVLFDRLDTHRVVLVGHDNVAFLMGTVLTIEKPGLRAEKKYGVQSVKILYHQSMAKFGLVPDEDGELTRVFGATDLHLIRYIGVPHPDPELESWAVFSIGDQTYIDQIENGSIPALTQEELEQRMLNLASKLTST